MKKRNSFSIENDQDIWRDGFRVNQCEGAGFVSADEKFAVRVFILNITKGWFYSMIDFLQELAKLNQTFRQKGGVFPM